VWLGENADHYYVLSRFLLSRMLTVTKVPAHPLPNSVPPYLNIFLFVFLLLKAWLPLEVGCYVKRSFL
jgi:hypothetical protein